MTYEEAVKRLSVFIAHAALAAPSVRGDLAIEALAVLTYTIGSTT
jgi:hypothetical protein